MVDVFTDAEPLLKLAAEMVGEVQLLTAPSAELLSDAQYCTHLIVDCVYKCVQSVKLASFPCF